MHAYDWDEFNSRILREDATFSPRLENVPANIHMPRAAPADGATTPSLFDLQNDMEGQMFASGT